MIFGYYLATLSLAALALAVVLVAAIMHPDRSDLPDAIAYVLLIFGGLNALGARWLFRPIARLLRQGRVHPGTLRRIEWLPLAGALWTVALTQIAVFPPLYVEHLVCPGCLLANLPMPAFLSFVGPMVFYSLFLATFVYFLMGDYCVRLKEYLYQAHRIAFPPGRGHLALTLAIAFLAVSVLPLTLFVFEQLFQTHLGFLLRLRPAQTFRINVFASLLLTASTLLFVWRRLTYPVGILMRAVRSLQRGHGEVRAPVVSSDELGQLTSQVNRLSVALRERQFLRDTFGQFVPEAVARAIIADRGVLRPQVREATVLFTDIRGFTGISEHLAPEQVLALLNEYFRAMGEAIQAHGGVITQFQGDAILASFNLPVADPEHAANALRAARRIAEIAASHRFHGGQLLATRIGVNSGPVVGGVVGASDRIGYTIHGDEVNLASRLEQLNKDYDSVCLVTQRTVTLAGSGFRFQALGEVEVPGRSQPVAIFRFL